MTASEWQTRKPRECTGPADGGSWTDTDQRDDGR